MYLSSPPPFGRSWRWVLAMHDNHHLETISITNQIVSDIPKAHDTSPITYEAYKF